MRISLFTSLTLRIIITILSFLPLTVSASQEKTLTREQVLKDAKTTENLLKKYHANLYAHRKPKQIKSIWNKAKSQLPKNPNFLDAATLAQQMLAAVCDEHTLVYLTDDWILRNGNYSRGEIFRNFPKRGS